MQEEEKILFFSDPTHRPVDYYVTHWSSDPHIQGAWSQLTVGGSPEDRRILGTKISDRLILAGEACHVKYPAMVHGAALSGIDAAKDLFRSVRNIENGQKLPVVVVGAGAAGIFAADALQSLLKCNICMGKDIKSCVHRKDRQNVIVLEAKDRHGGRVNTVTLGTSSGDSVEKEIRIDVGASWLQQFPDNFLAQHARNLDLDLFPTDFQDSLCAASDGLPISDLHNFVEALYDVTLESVASASSSEYGNAYSCHTDMSIVDALHSYIHSLSNPEQRYFQLALSGDINSDLGYYLHNTSAKHAMLELGIGNEDHYIKQGYSDILDPVASGLDIRYNNVVKNIDYSRSECVTITTSDGQVHEASQCICTVPVSVLKGPYLTFNPPLPVEHRHALGNIEQGKCEKVVLRYSTRWWPHSANGLYRWYDNAQQQNSFPMILNWNEWLDITDCVGVPTVIGFCVGEEAYSMYHGSNSDSSIAIAAADAFEMWAWHRLNLEQASLSCDDVLLRK